MGAIDNTWLDERITASKAAIVAYEAALLALTSGAQSYTIDTGQTRQTVTKVNLTEVRNALAAAENRLATLDARRRGGGLIARPGF